MKNLKMSWMTWIKIYESLRPRKQQKLQFEILSKNTSTLKVRFWLLMRKKGLKSVEILFFFYKNIFRKLVSEVGKNLKIDIMGLKSNNEKDLESEIERLKNSVRVKEDEIETKIICNICQEQVIDQKRCHWKSLCRLLW